MSIQPEVVSLANNHALFKCVQPGGTMRSLLSFGAKSANWHQLQLAIIITLNTGTRPALRKDVAVFHCMFSTIAVSSTLYCRHQYSTIMFCPACMVPQQG